MSGKLPDRPAGESESGATLVIFAAGLIVFLGLVAMSIDVGRYLWARTQMQAAVDAAALAAAQSMPSQTDAAVKANEYWVANSGFIRDQGNNVQLAVSYPVGNKAIRVRADADIPTWFARIFGINNWHVWAEGDAESQVLDISVVLDISGSMCFDSYPQTESGSSYRMSPGRLTPAGGYAFPRLAAAIPASSGSSINITLNDVRIFASTSASTNRSNFGTSWNSTTRYWQRSGSGYRAGIIMIDQEIFQITAVNTTTNTLTVTRARTNQSTGVPSVMQAHSANAEVWANRTGYSSTGDYCNQASYYQASSSQNGPHQPFDSAVSNAQYFTTLFDPAYDKIGLASYSTSATNRQALTSGFATVRSAMDNILYPTGSTNIAHGIGMGRQILDGSGKRANAVRVLVILTDGIPNVSCSNGYNSGSCSTVSHSSPSSCPATSTTAITDAINQAAVARAADITVYTIGLGADVLDCILEDIAEAGGGAYYKAPTTADLDEAFEAIAAQTHIALVR